MIRIERGGVDSSKHISLSVQPVCPRFVYCAWEATVYVSYIASVRHSFFPHSEAVIRQFGPEPNASLHSQRMSLQQKDILSAIYVT